MIHAHPFPAKTDGVSRILIVDDELSTVAGLQTALAFRFPDLHIDSACSVKEALAKLQTARYAVILTDLRMPGGSGLDLLQAICRSHPRTAVLVMSGHLDAPTASSVLEQGACAVLRKPLEREALMSAVTEALRTGTSYGTPVSNLVS